MGCYVVTGSASGIGAAVAEALTVQGHRVIGVDTHPSAAVADNLGSPAGRQQALGAIRAQLGQDALDGLVCCAGIGPDGRRQAAIPGINYFGTTALVEGLEPELAAARGAIVITSSNSAPLATDEGYVETLLGNDEDKARQCTADMDATAIYAGSKRALAYWMRHQTLRLARAGIRINAIAPGYTSTAMTRASEQDPALASVMSTFLESTPLRRPGKPEDQAAAVVFLLSPHASFITGELLYVDGGYNAMTRPEAI